MKIDEKRYSRQIILEEIGLDGQKKLKDSSVLLIGFGGLGSGVAMFLTRMGIGHLGIVEHDIVDISNLQRQILYDESDIGTSKLNSGIKKLRQINKDIIIDQYEICFNEEIADTLVKKYDVIVDCTDNFTTRGIINRSCIDNKKPCVFGAVNEFNGSIISYVDGAPCYECIMGNSRDFAQMDHLNSPVGVLGAMVGIVSSMEALEVVKIILDIGENAVGKMITIDGLDMSVMSISFKKNKECYCCKEE